MARLSEKYIAGFLDADGGISLVFHGYKHTPQLLIGFSQKTERDSVLYMIQEVAGGAIDHVVVNNISYTRLSIWSSKAKMLLYRIMKFLVIKKHYASIALDMADRITEDVEVSKKLLKEQRQIKSYPLPNFPSRKWMAGYIDGDGCFSINRISKNGNAQPIFTVKSSSFDSEGIELLYKAFGGIVHQYGNIVQYRLALPPSKAIEFLGLFINHLIIKKSQAELILECARMGHYHNGKHIKEQLKHLKAHEQRLNDSEIRNDLSDSPKPA